MRHFIRIFCVLKIILINEPLEYKGLMLIPMAGVFCFKVSKGEKIRNRYNQVPHLTQDTNWKVTNSQQTPQTRAKRSALSQQHRRAQRHSKHKTEQKHKRSTKEVPPWSSHCTVSKSFGGLNCVNMFDAKLSCYKKWEISQLLHSFFRKPCPHFASVFNLPAGR